MTSPAKNSKSENTFGSFALGVAVGVGAALLFGTDEGKKLASTLFDKLPESIKNLTDQTPYPEEQPLVSEPETTPHSYIYNEPPPPPAPLVHPSIPTNLS